MPAVFRKLQTPWLLTVLILVQAACGKPDSSSPRPGGSPGAGKGGGGDVDGANRNPPSGSRETMWDDGFSDLSGTLVEKAGLLPLGYFTLVFSGVERQCMGSYVGQGKFITAGHCFLGIPSVSGEVACPSTLRIQWLKKEGSALLLSPDKTACTKANVTYREGADAMDVAVVRLANVGTWPSASVTFQNGSVALGKKVVMVGPQGIGESLYFRGNVGLAYEPNGTRINTNSAHRAGYSGTPVFLYSDTEGTFEASAGAVGMHLGSGTGTSQFLRGESLEAFLH